MTWKKIRLGDLITESKIPSENPDPNKRITVRLKVLGVEKRGLENEITGATKQFVRKAGQFIYGRQNFHKGAFGIIPQELDGFETSADLPAFDVDDKCIPEWIYYFFKQGGFYLELASMARGVATQRIHPEQIYDLEVPLPDLNTQKKILNKLKLIEEKSALLSAKISNQLFLIDKLNQTILQEAVQGKLVKQNPKDEPASELLKRIKEEKEKTTKKEKTLPPIRKEEIPFEIPESWVWYRLGEITTLITDGKHGDCQNQSNSGYYFLSAKDVKNGELIYENARQITFDDFLETHRRTNLEPGDLCIVNTGATIGKTAFAKESDLTQKTTFQKSVAVIKAPKNLISLKFIEYLLIYETPKLVNISRGSAINNLLLGDMRNILVPLPPYLEQQRLVSEIENQFSKTKQLKEHIIANQEATEQLLKALLHQAFEVNEN